MNSVAVVATVEISSSAVERPFAVDPEVAVAKEAFAKMFESAVARSVELPSARNHKQLVGVVRHEGFYWMVRINAYVV